MKFSRPVLHYHPYLGCDPEFFFQNEGKTIGSEKIINLKAGLPVVNTETTWGSAGTGSKFIVDGVQAELNPRADTCRARLANEMRRCFATLKSTLAKHNGITASFIPLAKVDKEELAQLDKSSQVFGCAPSKSAAGESGIAAKSVDPSEYPYRSAGGHIHIGRLGYGTLDQAINDPERVVPILDILLGNTCVLLDRDPGNAERRKVYGRAGEYRTPKHGLEYRTLSNFWLRAYPLMSFVMSMARFSVEIVASTYETREYEKALLELVDMEDIRKAINENDFDLALVNFNKVKPFILAAASSRGDHHPLHYGNMEDFEFFVSKGLDHWFKHDVVEHWSKLPEGHHGGWESYVAEVVRPVRIATSKQVEASGVKTSKGIVPPPPVKPATPVDIPPVEVKTVEVEATAAPAKKRVVRKKVTTTKTTGTKKIVTDGPKVRVTKKRIENALKAVETAVKKERAAKAKA